MLLDMNRTERTKATSLPSSIKVGRLPLLDAQQVAELGRLSATGAFAAEARFNRDADSKVVLAGINVRSEVDQEVGTDTSQSQRLATVSTFGQVVGRTNSRDPFLTHRITSARSQDLTFEALTFHLANSRVQTPSFAALIQDTNVPQLHRPTEQVVVGVRQN